MPLWPQNSTRISTQRKNGPAPGEIGQNYNTEGNQVTQSMVYVGMVGDMLHAGHINIVTKARELGQVIVGVLTDEAAASYKRVPFMKYKERAKVVENIAGVARVVPQETLSYKPNLLEYKPKFVVHGDDWKFGDKVSVARQEVVDTLKEWGGELIEVPYTTGVSSTLFHQALEEQGVMARNRQARLRHLFEVKDCVRIIEAHSGLAALIASRTRSSNKTFDALWQSSLTDATLRGKPDIEIVDNGSRLSTINEIFEASTLPLIYDGDTGGFPERVHQLARSLDRAGVSALCLEDKTGVKRNSLYGQEAGQKQAPIEVFCERIQAAKAASGVGDMMFISRIESLILGEGQHRALERAEAYLDAGSDAILIHSTAKDSSEVSDFSRELRRQGHNQPLLVVPTTFANTPITELADAGINGVIYANQLLRAAYPNMVQVAKEILDYDCCPDQISARYLASTKDILDLIPVPR
ncbi:isocitrate lyase/phosphoenolpyruvate mutase family protein [Roseibium sp. AS2]|uniref:isocitrate lyase/phosphoenolpyruvate mutase family protein n=1 Tax=Roseibium sp. AS2 TaxID=3135781 RepID=UPI0031705416